MMELIRKRPEVPIAATAGKGSLYNDQYYCDSTIALAAYIADDRKWLIELVQKQRSFMEHEKTCPKRRHRNEECSCGLSSLLNDVITS